MRFSDDRAQGLDVEVGDFPVTLGDDDEVTLSDTMWRNVVRDQPRRVGLRPPSRPILDTKNHGGQPGVRCGQRPETLEGQRSVDSRQATHS